MSSINKVILLGNVGRDPQIKILEGGVKVASFTLATTERFKKNDEKHEVVEWHNIVMWRGLADNVEQSELKKGDRIYVEGKIRSRKWQDKDGNDKVTYEIQSDSFTIINRKKVAEEHVE